MHGKANFALGIENDTIHNNVPLYLIVIVFGNVGFPN